MAEPISITNDAMFLEIGKLYMETRFRASREDSLVKLVQSLQAKTEEVAEEPPKRVRGR